MFNGIELDIVAIEETTDEEEDLKFLEFQKLFERKTFTQLRMNRINRDFDVINYLNQRPFIEQFDQLDQFEKELIHYLKDEKITIFYQGNPIKIPELLNKLNNNEHKCFEVYLESFLGALTFLQSNSLLTRHDSINSLLNDIHGCLDYEKTTHE